MNPLVLIPARGGSKRLPGKNMAMLGGKTLIEWAILSANRAGFPVAVSTDDEAIGAEARRHKADLYWRGPALASDEATSIDIVRDLLRSDHDAVVLLQPTSPLRTADDVLGAWRLWLDTKADAVISVKNFQPRVLTLGHADRLREHNLNGRFYIENGAIYILSGEAIRAGHDWYTCPVTYGFRMPAARSIDIDTPADLEDARKAVERGLFDV